MIKKIKRIIKNILKLNTVENKNYLSNVTKDRSQGDIIHIDSKRIKNKSRCLNCCNSLEGSIVSNVHNGNLYYVVCSNCGAVNKFLDGTLCIPDKSEAPLAYRLFKTKGNDFRAFIKNKNGDFEKLDIEYK